MPLLNTSTMPSKMVNEDLQKERGKCNFDIEQLTNLLDRGENYTKQRRFLGML